MDSLKREVEEMERELTKLSCPLVLCHNDLQSRNIIYNDQDGNEKVFFICAKKTYQYFTYVHLNTILTINIK